MTEHYFAYGSNLNEAQMRKRCPSVELVAPAILRGYRLGFSGMSRSWGGGVATIYRDKRQLVPGIIWSLSRADLAQLDGFEGHPDVYRRRRLGVELAHGKYALAHVYIKLDQEATLPSEPYFQTVLAAYRRYGFDEAALKTAVLGAI